MENGDYRDMSDRKFEEQTGEMAAFKAAYGRVSWDQVARDMSSEEFAKGVADLMSDDLPAGIEEAQAWKAGHDGITTDRDVWAYLAVYDGEDEVELIRGRVDGLRFELVGSDGWDDRDVANVICWTETEDRPAFSLAVAKATVAALERLERLGHGHCVEDWLHREALRTVVAGHPDAQAIAAAALESRTVKFTRYYS